MCHQLWSDAPVYRTCTTASLPHLRISPQTRFERLSPVTNIVVQCSFRGHALAILQVTRGGIPGTRYELNAEKTRLGRDSSNDVLVDFLSVSRNHAIIVREGDGYFIEDLKSRNGTYVNGQLVEKRQQLCEGDEVEVCDVIFRFFHGNSPTNEVSHRKTQEMESLDSDSDRFKVGEYVTGSKAPVSHVDSSASSIVATLQAGDSSRSWRFSVRPEPKLRAIIQILKSLGSRLTVDEVLQSILDGLFKIFPQAEQGFIMLHDPERDRLKLEATRVRRVKQAEVNVSMTIVRQALRSGEAILSADASDDSRFDMSESLQNLKIRSLMCVPLLTQDDVRLGVIQIDTSNMVEQFSSDDLEIMLAVATPVGFAITNARFIQREFENRALQRELEFAREIQQGYLPRKLPDAPGYDIAHYYESAEQIGGDYFDCFAIKDNRVCLAIGDVAGKGVPAALLMSRLYSAVRTQMLMTGDPVATMTSINQEFTFDQSVFRFITVMIVVIDPGQGGLEIVNAGHSPMLLADSTGRVELVGIKDGGMPIGVLADQEFATTTAELGVGGQFAVYSDGITEAMNGDKQLFGRARLSNLISDRQGTAREQIDRIVRTVDEFRAGRAQEDDSCLAVVRRVGT